MLRTGRLRDGRCRATTSKSVKSVHAAANEICSSQNLLKRRERHVTPQKDPFPSCDFFLAEMIPVHPLDSCCFGHNIRHSATDCVRRVAFTPLPSPLTTVPANNISSFSFFCKQMPEVSFLVPVSHVVAVFITSHNSLGHLLVFCLCAPTDSVITLPSLGAKSPPVLANNSSPATYHSVLSLRVCCSAR